MTGGAESAVLRIAQVNSIMKICGKADQRLDGIEGKKYVYDWDRSEHTGNEGTFV